MKRDRPARRGSVEPVLLRLPAVDAAPVGPPCPHCSSPLTLHQPDPGWPERLLGACGACRHWFLMDLLPGQAESVLEEMPLPNVPAIRDHPHKAASGGSSPMVRDPGASSSAEQGGGQAEISPEKGPGEESPPGEAGGGVEHEASQRSGDPRGG